MSTKRYTIVINRSDETPFVLEKAATLASAKNADVQVVRIIHNDLVDFPHTSDSEAQSLKISMMQSEHTFLDDLLDDMRSRFKSVQTLVVWDKRVSEGTLAAAREFNADMIIKGVGADAKYLVRTPDDWNLLREIGLPVLLLQESPWEADRAVLAAVDLLNDAHDADNERIIRTSEHLASELGGNIHLVFAYPGISGSALMTNADKRREQIEKTVSEKLHAISDSKNIEQLHIEEGPPAVAVNKAVLDSRAEIVVLGNAARKGVAGTLFGNTSEALLSKVDADLLVIPT